MSDRVSLCRPTISSHHDAIAKAKGQDGCAVRLSDSMVRSAKGRKQTFTLQEGGEVWSWVMHDVKKRKGHYSPPF
jgi:hypothetical protein